MASEHKSGAAWTRPNPPPDAGAPAAPPRVQLRVLPTLNTDGSRRKVRPR
jgi:hypothetical protein